MATLGIELIVDAVIDIINKNIIAKTNVTSNVTSGDIFVRVENSFQFSHGQEIVLIDYGYDVEGSTHYNVFEYAKILEVNNTTTITLTAPVVGNWLVADKAFVQKTIGHAPLYENNVFYGDREVIPLDQMAIAVEPTSLSNDWIYIQGGLSEEYRLQILIYGRDIKFEEGRRILDRYSDAVYQLMMNNLHLELDNYHTPLTDDYIPGSSIIKIADNDTNRSNITTNLPMDPYDYQMQDNKGASCWFHIIKITPVTPVPGGEMTLTIDPISDTDDLFAVDAFRCADFAILKKWSRTEYIYDSRVSDATFGKVSKGSAFLRASELNWWGKKVHEHVFPQRSNRV